MKESSERLAKQLKETHNQGKLSSKDQPGTSLGKDSTAEEEKRQMMEYYMDQIETLENDNKQLRKELATTQSTIAIQSKQREIEEEENLSMRSASSPSSSLV